MGGERKPGVSRPSRATRAPLAYPTTLHWAASTSAQRSADVPAAGQATRGASLIGLVHCDVSKP
jgi:hypothetical protein